MPELLGPDGLPIKLKTRELKGELAAPTEGGVRSIQSGNPASGLVPQRLAGLLKAAETGDTVAYLELAEQLEERDLHYQGVLGTRKRAVTQLEITVEAASEDAADGEAADFLRAWLERDTLEDELFDVLDAVGKGFSVTEIHWGEEGGKWLPQRLEWRDPRWFRLDRVDGRTPRLRDGSTDGADLPAGKFIIHEGKAKSGLPIRGGLARGVAWMWMFKSFSVRDWVVFLEVYGQPIRIGRYPASATKEDIEILWNAVRRIGSDVAAIIPAGMEMEFVRAEGQATSGPLFKDAADWFNREISKAVLGQTATTEGQPGSHAIGSTHNDVRGDIERADANALAATLNRDLVRPLIALNLPGAVERGRWPRLKIGREDEKDVKLQIQAAKELAPLGLRIKQQEIREAVGFSEPDDDDEILAARVAPPAQDEEGGDEDAARSSSAARGSARKSLASRLEPEARETLEERLAEAAAKPVAALLDALEEAASGATSFDDLQARLAQAAGGHDVGELATVLANDLALAELVGRADVQEGADDAQ